MRDNFLGFYEMHNVRLLSSIDRDDFLEHFRTLDHHARYCRFLDARSSESAVDYASKIDFFSHVVLGYFDPMLVGVAEISRVYKGSDLCAEFAVSVQSTRRGEGIGSILMTAALLYARQHGICRLFLSFHVQNIPLYRIVRAYGFDVQKTVDGFEAEICVLSFFQQKPIV